MVLGRRGRGGTGMQKTCSVAVKGWERDNNFTSLPGHHAAFASRGFSCPGAVHSRRLMSVKSQEFQIKY